MANFNEHALEMSIMELFKDEGYTYVSGDQIHRERTEVLLTDDLKQYLYNRYAKDGITPSEVDSVILMLRNISGTIYEANKAVFKLLCDGFILNREDRTQKDLYIELIDFDTPENNIFKAVNQFEIEGINNQLRIPDGIVFVNGIPVVVLEFKSAVQENTTIMDAYKQLTTRYRRDIPEIFKYNAFVVISDGANNKYGSFFSPYDFFYAWRKINSDDKELDGINSLVTMIKGLFRKDRLLEVIKDFIYFPDNSDKDLKIVCRYSQFFAANKLYENIKAHLRPEGDGKGGTYFGATGCGKSYTMLFLTRMLMKSKYFSSPTILIITDRTDLDDQLSKQFVGSKKYIGDETVVSIESREKLREELQGRESGGVYLTTIQKFTEDLQLLTDRTNVICISDEAHRSQINLDQKVKITESGVQKTYGFAKYLHDSLPNATYVGFTGTPVDGTIEVFGGVVDAYTMTEAVKDGITVNLVYDGRAAKVMLNQDKVRQIEEYYAQCELEGANEHQVEESQKAVAKMEVIIGDPDRLRAVAEDFIKHYETRVAEGATVAGKAMFVCSNRNIAYDFYKIIKELRPEWTEKKICDDGVVLSEKDKKELKPMEKIKLVMTRNKDDEKDLFDMLGTKEDRKEFDRQFKNPKSNFKIAIVVDMWLTGFDVPELDTIYIDKPIQQHTLIQTISRVNRVCEGKDKGLIVDYIGIKKNMNTALKKYTNFESEEFEGVEQSITIVKDQLEVLGQMFHNFNSSDFFNGSPTEQLACLNRAVEYVQLSEELERRFMAAVKRMKQAFNLCSSSEKFSDEDKDYIHFYCAVRSILFKLTKGDAPDIEQMNARVRKMLEGAIQSDGIEELFETGKHISVDIFSDEYMDKINAIQLPNTKIKILQRLLSQAIDEFKKVNKIMGVEFADRLKKVVDEYNNRRRDEAYANEVLDDVAEQLAQLLSELKTEKNSFKNMGIDYEEKAFSGKVSMGMITGKYQDYDADFIFATIQSMSKTELLERYDRDAFDAIIIDEAHHSAANSYKKVMEYFTPELWLGMTATPDKRDDNLEGRNIYEIFNHQIACEIRLQDAMKEDLLCPFHYFGITDLDKVTDSGKSVKEKVENFRYLTSDERVCKVMEQAKFFGYSGERVKGLIFCSRIDEARELSKKFNEKGWRTLVLSGSDSEDARVAAIERLAGDESEDALDYILSVEIFSEGVDVPEINQVIMLRPTESPIVFIQQLGRGLRKAENKEYVVVLDFIGNYRNNFMIPVALSGDRSYNSDTIRKYVISGNNTIPGASTIHFDEISKEKIFHSIDKIRGVKAIIRESYAILKNRLGRVPYLMDFYENGEVDPLVIIGEYKTYQDFLCVVEAETYTGKMSEQEKLTLEYVSKTVLSGVRPYELEILKSLFEEESISGDSFIETMKQKYSVTDKKILDNAINVLEGHFVSKEEEYKRFKNIEILEADTDKMIRRMQSYTERLKHVEFCKQMKDLVDVGLKRYEDKYSVEKRGSSLFVLYEKYSRRDVSFLMNCGKDLSSTMYGMKRIDNDVFIFVTYHKVGAESEEKLYADGKPDYADVFTDNMIFKWDSQIGKGPESGYMKDVLGAERKHLLVKKSDAETSFYYMGTFDIVDVTGDKKKDNNGRWKDISKVTVKMHHAVREDLLRYLESKIITEEKK